MLLQCDIWTYFMTAVYKPIKRFCSPTPLDKQCTALPESLYCFLGQTDPCIKTALANFRNSLVICIWPPKQGESSFGQIWSFSWLFYTAQRLSTQKVIYICVRVCVSIKIYYKSISLPQLKAESTFLISVHKTWQSFIVRFLKYICL